MANMTFKASLLPNTSLDDSCSLGNSEKKWKVYGNLIGNADTATQWKTARTLTIGDSGKNVDGSANISWNQYEMKVVRAKYDSDTNLNTFAEHGHAIGMCNLGNNGSVDNPGGKTGWHNIFQATWRDTANNNGTKTNEWCTQIANACGSSDLYVRSRNGGTIANGTAWTAPWTKILTTSNYTGTTDGRYVKKAGDTMTGTLTMNMAGTQLIVPYNGTNYGVLHNHNNGNYSLSATSGGLYIGYYNTTHMDWLVGKMQLYKSDGRLYLKGQYIQHDDAVTSQSWIDGRNSAAVRVARWNNYHAGLSMKTANGSWEIGVYTNNNLWFSYAPDSNYNAGTNSVAQCHIDSSAHVWGAVWNDYAEMRNVPIANDYLANGTHSKLAGHCVYELGDDTMALTTERLQRGCKIISDTFGFNIGETENAKTPIAVSGRVLAYCFEGREEAKKYIGYGVCSGPNGMVSIMTEEEERMYPMSIIGTISAVPNYEEWGEDHIKVNGRIWIYVK